MIRLLRNSSSKLPMQIQSFVFSPVRFTTFITLAISVATTAVSKAQLTAGLHKLVVSHGAGTLPGTSPNNVILLQQHHTPWLQEPSCEACSYHIVCVDIVCVCVCVCVWSLCQGECRVPSQPVWNVAGIADLCVIRGLLWRERN